MTCSDFLESFSEYRDGVASADLTARVETHLSTCESCRRYARVYEQGAELLRSLPEAEVADDFHPRLQHRIYHVADGDLLELGGPTASATTTATAVAMTFLLVVAAWSPTLLVREPVVDLTPIVVSDPPPSSFGLQPIPGSLFLGSGELDRDMPERWAPSRDLLYRYSPLAERAGRARVRRTGLD